MAIKRYTSMNYPTLKEAKKMLRMTEDFHKENNNKLISCKIVKMEEFSGRKKSWRVVSELEDWEPEVFGSRI